MDSSTELEIGFDVKIGDPGTLQISMNTPTGHVLQQITIRPSTAYALKQWLDEQDWDDIRRRARAIDVTDQF